MPATLDESLLAERKVGEILITLTGDFHFNEKAPNQSLVDGKSEKPSLIKAKSLTFKVPNSFGTAAATVYVCDDQLTTCQARKFNFAGEGRKVAPSMATVAKAKQVTNKFGFIENSLGQALEKAKSEKKLVLAEFGARWCPGCIRLETEIFGQKKFKTLTKSFIKVHLDSDVFENSVLNEKYQIKGIPTLMVLDSTGAEISRVVDFQPLETIEAFLSSADANRLSINDLKTKVAAGDTTASLVLGQRLYAANRFEESVPFFETFEKSGTRPIELFDARIQAAVQITKKDPTKVSNLIQLAQDTIAREPTSSRSLQWRILLLKQLPKADHRRQQVFDDGVALADQLLKQPAKLPQATAGDLVGEYKGYEVMLVAAAKAELAAAADLNPAQIEDANREAAKVATDLKIPVSNAGPSLRHLLFLMNAKQFSQAQTLAEKMLKQDPGNPEIQRRLIRILNELGKYSEAISVGEKALKKSYGQNEIWVALQLAKAYQGAGKTNEARSLLTDFLARAEMQWPSANSDRVKMTSLLAELPQTAL